MTGFMRLRVKFAIYVVFPGLLAFLVYTVLTAGPARRPRRGAPLEEEAGSAVDSAASRAALEAADARHAPASGARSTDANALPSTDDIARAIHATDGDAISAELLALRDRLAAAPPQDADALIAALRDARGRVQSRIRGPENRSGVLDDQDEVLCAALAASIVLDQRVELDPASAWLKASSGLPARLSGWGAVVGELARTRGVSAEGIEAEVEETLARLRKELVTDGKASLPGLGVLRVRSCRADATWHGRGFTVGLGAPDSMYAVEGAQPLAYAIRALVQRGEAVELAGFGVFARRQPSGSSPATVFVEAGELIEALLSERLKRGAGAQ